MRFSALFLTPTSFLTFSFWVIRKPKNTCGNWRMIFVQKGAEQKISICIVARSAPELLVIHIYVVRCVKTIVKKILIILKCKWGEKISTMLD